MALTMARMPITNPASARKVFIPVCWFIELMLELIATNWSFMLVIWYCMLLNAEASFMEDEASEVLLTPELLWDDVLFVGIWLEAVALEL